MKVNWHLYPGETPPEYGRYLVSSTRDDNSRYVFITEYIWDEFRFPVDAWAELPEPFSGLTE